MQWGFDANEDSAMNAHEYGSELAAVLLPERLMELGPGTPNEPMRAKIAALKLPPACMAGVWLYHDFLDESHTISQELDDATGSYWHAIMHRREPDAENSKYWFRKVGQHPVLKLLTEKASELGYEYTGPFDFVDFCEHVRGVDTSEEEIARRMQLLEWELFFDHCHQSSQGE